MARACILVALLAVACSTTVSSAVSTTTNGIGTWTDLFQPPYNTTGLGYNAGLSCNTDTSCYVYSTTNLYSFNGAPNGIFTPLMVPDLARPITAIVVSGPMDAPGGAVVSEDYGKPVKYPVNNMAFMSSNIPEGMLGFFVNSLDARASTNGQEVIVINSNPSGVLYSSNGGKDFNLKTINVKLATNCTAARYGHMVDKNTWYVTMGSAPVRGCKAASAQIVKTTDGGNTWTTQFSEVSNFFFNAIDCLSATHCVAVGGGFGAYIYRTVDGQTWDLVFTSNAFPNLLRANAHGHFFAAGYRLNQARTSSVSYILASVDGGATWVEENPIPNVIAITSLSFTPGGVGFATASCYSDGDSTILRYDPAPSQLLH